MPTPQEQILAQMLGIMGGQQTEEPLKLQPSAKEAGRLSLPELRSLAAGGLKREQFLISEAKIQARLTRERQKHAEAAKEIRKLKTQGKKETRQIKMGRGPEAPELRRVISLLRSKHLEAAGGTVEAQALEERAARKFQGVIRELHGKHEGRFANAGVTPPDDLPKRIGAIAAGDRFEERRLNQILKEGKEAQTLSVERQAITRRLEAAGEQGKLFPTKGASKLTEQALGTLGEAKTLGEVQRIGSEMTPKIAKAAKRMRMVKGGGLAAIAALLAPGLLKSAFGGKEAKGGPELTSQQQFQLAMAMAQNQGKGGGGSESLEMGRQLNNLSKTLAIAQELQSALGMMNVSGRGALV